MRIFSIIFVNNDKACRINFVLVVICYINSFLAQILSLHFLIYNIYNIFHMNMPIDINPSYPVMDQNAEYDIMKDQESQESKEITNQQLRQSFDDQTLVELHKIYGNKWKKISTHFMNRNDSFIKNHFYSLLRRSLRRLNSYTKRRNKQQSTKNKVLKLNFVFKLTNLAQSQREGNFNNRYYTRLLYQFLELNNKIIGKNKIQKASIDKFQIKINKQLIPIQIDYEKVQNLIDCLKQIQHFFMQNNLNKKGKSKKKCPKKLLQKKDILIKQNSKNQSLSEQTKHIIFDSSDYQIQQKDKAILEAKEKLLSSPTATKFSMNLQQARFRSFDFQEESDNYMGISVFSFENHFDPALFK